MAQPATCAPGIETAPSAALIALAAPLPLLTAPPSLPPSIFAADTPVAFASMSSETEAQLNMALQMRMSQSLLDPLVLRSSISSAKTKRGNDTAEPALGKGAAATAASARAAAVADAVMATLPIAAAAALKTSTAVAPSDENGIEDGEDAGAKAAVEAEDDVDLVWPMHREPPCAKRVSRWLCSSALHNLERKWRVHCLR